MTCFTKSSLSYDFISVTRLELRTSMFPFVSDKKNVAYLKALPNLSISSTSSQSLDFFYLTTAVLPA